MGFSARKDRDIQRGSNLKHAVRAARTDTRRSVVSRQIERGIMLRGCSPAKFFRGPHLLRRRQIIRPQCIRTLQVLLQRRDRKRLIRGCGGKAEFLSWRQPDDARQRQFLFRVVIAGNDQLLLPAL